MVSIERVLCPVDFSACSRHALDYAVAIGAWYEAAVTALHVFSIPPAVEIMPSVGVAGLPPLLFTEADREALIGRLREFAPAAAADPRVRFRVEEAPDVRAEILQQAEVLASDLIVVGSHGRSGFQHLLLGSTTERLLRKARVPVLVVPRHAEAAVPPAMPFRRIVCPVDFSEASLQALEMALRLAEEGDARIVLVHVIEMPPALHEMQDVLTREVNDIRAEAEARAVTRLRALVPEGVREACDVRVAVVEGSAHREILRTALDEQSDLIVMGVRGRGAVDTAIFGSNTHAVLRQAQCPVLSVHHP